MKEKKIQKKKWVIVVLAVIFAAVGVGGFFWLMPKSIEGEWELTVNPEVTKSTPDEANGSQKVYYTFSKPGEYGDGTYKTIYDGGVEEGSYKLSEKDGKKLINLGTEDMQYQLSGSSLTITFPESTNEQTGQKTPAQDYVFNRAKAPEYDKESYDSYDTDKALTAKWVTKERKLTYYTSELSYTETVAFTENGIMSIHYESRDLALDRYMYYACTAKDGKLSFSPVTDKKTKYSVSYKFDKDGNLQFTNDKTSGSIFADEFFSGVTYHKAD